MPYLPKPAEPEKSNRKIKDCELIAAVHRVLDKRDSYAHMLQLIQRIVVLGVVPPDV